MSLSARDQQSLDDIADSLANSAPKLAAMLATFTRLTSGEEMPTGEEVAAVRPATRGARRLFHGSALQPAAPVLWMLIAIAVLAIAVAAGRGGRGDGCVKSWAVACGNPAPIHSSRPTPKTATDQPSPAVPHPVPPAVVSPLSAVVVHPLPPAVVYSLPPAIAHPFSPAVVYPHSAAIAHPLSPAAVRPLPAARGPVT